MQKFYGKKIEELTPSDLIELVTKWKDALVNLDKQLQHDAGKEFTPKAQIGYGIDCDSDQKLKDFESVRGTLENDKFLSDLKNHIKTKTEFINDLINTFSSSSK